MPDLRDMLNEKTVLLNWIASDWKEAIRIGGKMLVDVQACEPKYIDAMIRFAEELGPYIVIGKGSGVIFKGSGFYLTDYKNKNVVS